MSKFCYCLFRHNPPSHIRLLSLAFFGSTLTPTPSMHTIGSGECKGQAYTAIWFPHRVEPQSQATIKGIGYNLAQSKAIAIIQRDTQVEYTSLIFWHHHYHYLYTIIVSTHSPSNIDGLVPYLSLLEVATEERGLGHGHRVVCHWHCGVRANHSAVILSADGDVMVDDGDVMVDDDDVMVDDGDVTVDDDDVRSLTLTMQFQPQQCNS